MTDDPFERVFFEKRYQSITFDFTGRALFARYDHCKFVKCEILIDEQTETLSFTRCEFQDCNIDSLQSNEERNLISRDNVFLMPIKEAQASFDKRLADALSHRENFDLITTENFSDFDAPRSTQR